MKTLIASLAMFAATAASAVTFGNLTLTGPAFAPQSEATLSTAPGFADNFTAPIGPVLGNFNGKELTLYSKRLPNLLATPPASTAYLSTQIAGDLANFLNYTAPFVTNAEAAAAVQLGVWKISDVNFSVAANLTLGNAQALSSQWITEAERVRTSSFPVFSLDNKSYASYVYTTSPVPELSTGTLSLFGLAVVAVAAIKRR